MPEHPITFQAESVRAILARRKTQTRRVITQRNSLLDGRRGRWPDGEYQWDKAWVDDGPSPAGNPGPYLKLPRVVETFTSNHGPASIDELVDSLDDGATEWTRDCDEYVHRVYSRVWDGDCLWVRETFADLCREADPFCWCETEEDLRRNHYTEYRADSKAARPGGWPDDDPGAPKWCSPIFMRRNASRITLKVTDVRVQRLREISEEDAIAEGVDPTETVEPAHDPRCDGSCRFCPIPIQWLSYIEAYAEAWDAINGKKPGRSWADNPWVWCISFEVAEVKP